MPKIPDRLRTALLEAMMTLVMRAPFTVEEAPNLPDGWQLCWCSDCSASLVMHYSDGFVAYNAIADVGPLMHAAECPWAWLADA